MPSKINHFSGLYIFSFAAIGSLFPLIGQYLAEIGYSGLQIGMITSSSTAIGIIANPFWGGVYHNKNRNKGIVMFLCLMTALLSLGLMLIQSFFFFLLLYVVIFFFETPIFPLIDATTLEANYPFGVARKWGAVGFALGIGVAGPLTDGFGLIIIFPLFAALLMMTSGVLGLALRKRVRLPSAEEPNTDVPDAELFLDRRATGEYKILLGNRKYMALLFSLFFYLGPTMAHNTYFSFLYVEGGGSMAGMGVALFLMVICEAPVMGWADRIGKMFCIERVILLALVISAVRFFWYSTTPPSVLLMGTFFLQGFTNGIILVEAIQFIARLVEPKQLSLALPLYTAIAANAGTISSQLLGGVAMEFFGAGGVYFLFGVANLIGITVYMASGLHKKPAQESLK